MSTTFTYMINKKSPWFYLPRRKILTSHLILMKTCLKTAMEQTPAMLTSAENKVTYMRVAMMNGSAIRWKQTSLKFVYLFILYIYHFLAQKRAVIPSRLFAIVHFPTPLDCLPLHGVDRE